MHPSPPVQHLQCTQLFPLCMSMWVYFCTNCTATRLHHMHCTHLTVSQSTLYDTAAGQKKLAAAVVCTNDHTPSPADNPVYHAHAAAPSTSISSGHVTRASTEAGQFETISSSVASHSVISKNIQDSPHSQVYCTLQAGHLLGLHCPSPSFIAPASYTHLQRRGRT